MQRHDVKHRLLDIVLLISPQLVRVGVRDDSTLAELGLDSIRVIELAARIEQQFGFMVDIDDWIDEERPKGDAGFTIGSLVDFIAVRIASTDSTVGAEG